MKNINVLIVEDKKIESDALIEVLEANNFIIQGVARTHADALRLCQSSEIDIIVIDVFLGENPDGIAFAETLSLSPNLSKPFVFLTSSKDRGIFERAKITKPYAFLLKPFNELEVLYALEMAIEKYFDQTDGFEGQETGTVLSQDHMFIKKKGALQKVLTNDIVYVEVEDRYCNIFTAQEKFVVLISLTRIENLLKDNGFIRTHRNFLVNQSKIIQIRLSEGTIVLEGDFSVLLGDSYKDFIKKINILS